MSSLLARRLRISIHALREEGDRRGTGERAGRNIFLSTPSARRATATYEKRVRQDMKFLSTPSARRATGEERSQVEQLKFLSTPSARRATSTPRVRSDTADISIHALREEGDSRLSMMRCTSLLFLSTPSARRATQF